MIMKIPKFLLYGENDPKIESNIQPQLPLRKWGELSDEEKNIAFQELINKGWIDRQYLTKILETIEYLNSTFLRQCPGKHLHSISARVDFDSMQAALIDFKHIFLNEKSDALVFRMLSKYTESFIYTSDYHLAVGSQDNNERKKLIDEAFFKFDKLADCLNHIFEQFAVNQLVTRNGFIPRQDDKVTEGVYIPTLHILADPKWKSVSMDLAQMFDDYREEKYAEAITKAHRAVQRFLQVLVGEEGKSGKGEVGKLFQKAKESGEIPMNQFTEPFITIIQKFIASERATNSTAKPSIKEATASDALFMMNIVMVFLQYCLQE